MIDLYKLHTDFDRYRVQKLNTRWDNGYDDQHDYIVHRFLVTLPFPRYDEHIRAEDSGEKNYIKAQIVLANLECKVCQKYFLGIFTIKHQYLLDPDIDYNWEGIGWCNNEYPLTTFGYLKASKDVYHLSRKSNIDKWKAEGSFLNKPFIRNQYRFDNLFRDLPDLPIFVGNEKMSFDKVWESLGSRSGDIIVNPPHVYFEKV